MFRYFLRKLIEVLLDAEHTLDKIDDIERRVAALEGGTQVGTQTPSVGITSDPSTWPPRTPKNGADVPPKGKKEYKSDGVDLRIALAILGSNPDAWETIRFELARKRRLTTQQVAELKARIKRQNLLESVA